MSFAGRYPLLHTPARWEWGGLDVRFSTELPADELVTNVHVVCFVGERIVLCRDDRDFWLLPGGTREAGESVDECLRRELREEAGARPVGPVRWLGAHHATSDAPEPYRPWQPHPHKAWLWCAADVVVDASPSNPPDAEQIIEVRAFAFEDALAHVTTDGAYLPELLTLARELHRPTAG